MDDGLAPGTGHAGLHDPDGFMAVPDEAARALLARRAGQASGQQRPARTSDDGDGGDEGGEEDGGGPLDLPEHIAPMGHADLARQDTGDDEAYALRPNVSWMRADRAAGRLRVEEFLVRRALRR